jgi:hypothetical protein
MTTKTTLAKNAAWPGKPAGQAHANVDPGKLQICDDPLPAKRQQANKKYEALLAKMKPGQAIRCETREVGSIAGAMRKWISEDKKRARTLMVKTCTHYPGAKTQPGRVWLLLRDDMQ